MTVDLQLLMQHQDDIAAAFHTLLLPCPFCGHKITKNETRGFAGSPSIHCECGAWMSGGILEMLMQWNRRDGKEFSMKSEYAQRLLESESRRVAFEKGAFQTFKKMENEQAGLRAARDTIAAKLFAMASVQADASPCLACGICPTNRPFPMEAQACFAAVMAWAEKEGV